MKKNLIECQKYLMTEADGVTEKVVVYKGSREGFMSNKHTLYVIEDDTEIEVPDMFLPMMNLREIVEETT